MIKAVVRKIQSSVPAIMTSAEKRLSHLEHELETALERYELVWQATNDVLYDLDIKSGRIIWNKALYEQFGYGHHEPTDSLEWWVSHIHPEDALSVEANLDTWFASKQSTWRGEYRFRKANGEYSDVLDRGYLLRDASGLPQRIIGVMLDISDHKRLERAKDEFISLVSHQLRTPLTVIRIYGEMFAEGMLGPLTPAQSEHLARMTNASVRLIELVDDILHLSRIELGKFDVRRKWINANQVIDKILQEMQPLAASKGMQISFTPHTAANRIFTDSEVLGQIVENLVANAIRYTLPKRGEATVSIATQKQELVIAVHDNGIGIPRADQKHIFERFYRANNAINIEEHGTGLGLYLARVLTEALGGRIWFDSSKKAGTTFYIAVPRA